MNALSFSGARGFDAFRGTEAVIAGAAGAVLILLALLGTGAVLSRIFTRDRRALTGTEHLLVGALAWSHGIFLTAWCGAWRPEAGLLLLVPAALLGLRELHGPRESRAHAAIPLRTTLRAYWPVFPVALVFLGTLGTPTVFWDSRAYHLAIPELIARSGSLVETRSYVYAWYPQAMEMLYVLCVPFGDASARLLNAAFLVAAAAVTARAARSPLAGVLFLAMPGTLMLAYAPKNIGLLALAGIVALERLLGGLRGDDARRGKPGETGETTALPISAFDAAPDRRDLAVAGLAAGAALATHYGALWGLVVVTILAALRAGPRSATLVATFATLAGGLPYLRNLLVRDNPFFPFFSGVFGTEPTLSTQAAQLPAPAQLLERLVLDPWTGVEALGIGSTHGLVVPAGLLLALLALRSASRRSVGAFGGREIAYRLAAGLGLLAIGIALYGFTRFGIAGLLVVLPVAAAGLAPWRRAAEWACALYALAGALLLVTGPFDPLVAYRLGPDTYRGRYDAAWTLAATARALPEGTRIASVGILRPQGWNGRLEPACEDFSPAIVKALEDTRPERALRAAGYTHLALDGGEVARLRRQYGYLGWSDAAESRFHDLLARSHLIADARASAFLAELPPAPEVR